MNVSSFNSGCISITSIRTRQGNSQSFTKGLGGFKVLGRVCCAAAPRKNVGGNAKTPKKKKPNTWSTDLREEPPKKTEKEMYIAPDDEYMEILASKMFVFDQRKVLQEEELIPTPLWKTFSSNNRGMWKGVGAVFSPDTGELQPISLRDDNRGLYDCRLVNFVYTDKESDAIHREVLWAPENAEGEKGTNQFYVQNDIFGQNIEEELDGTGSSDDIFSENDEAEGSYDESLSENDAEDEIIEDEGAELISKFTYEGMDEVMEIESIVKDPGLVFFEDGSYSWGPSKLLGTGADYTPVFNIEQCLVRGGHKRVRIVHSLLVNEDTEEVDVVRLAVYEEVWTCPVEQEVSGPEPGEKLQELLSQRPRTDPRRLAGRWKVFELNSIAVEEQSPNNEGMSGTSYACKEFSRRRRLPKVEGKFQAEVLWLTGGYFAYTYVEEASGEYIVGAGWHCDNDATVLTMERVYSPEGELLEVDSHSELRE